MKTIGILANFDKTDAEASVKRVVSRAARLGLRLFGEADVAAVATEVTPCSVESFSALGVEAVAVLGGDGTMLKASHRLAGQNLPLMGLNIGSLGYLTSVEESLFDTALEQLRDGGFTVSPRSMLRVEVVHSGGTHVCLPDALNDVVVSRGASGTAVELDLMMNDRAVSRFLCDGILVATPTGSTAYSLSAGGPILLPDAEALVISLICPHTLTSRPLVVRDTARLSVRAVACDSPMLVSSDGGDNEPLSCGDVVNIAKSTRTLSVIELRGYNPCDVLRRKLGWGGRAHVRSEERK